MHIAVVAKDALMRDGVQSLLANEGRMTVAGGSESVSHAARQLGGVGVLAVFVEGFGADDWIQLGEVKANGAIRIALIERPDGAAGAFKSADVVILTSDGSVGMINAVRRLVGEDFVAPPGLLMPRAPAIVQESIGNVYGTNRRGLTRRELDVARLVAQGMSNRRISQMLQLQEQSIKNLVSSIMRKLECENRVQIALKLTGSPTASNED